jgi:PKHD-type hydroxylase
MIVPIPDLISPGQVADFRRLLDGADWNDGRVTAGHLAAAAKHNQQLAPDDPLAARLGDVVLQALGANRLFMATTLPLRVLPPRFNRYADGGNYGFHVDGAVMNSPGTALRVRTDLAATLFLSAPDEYDGGDLVIQDVWGERALKLPAGHLVLYPGTSVHRVTPVTRGARVAAFFWVQSLVREDSQRTLLLELDLAIQKLALDVPGHAEIERLTGVYHNLLRRWSDT